VNIMKSSNIWPREMHDSFEVNSDGFPPIERVSLARQVTGMIRHAIVTGQLPPGEVISPQEIGKLVNVSRTPVREALIHLSAIGLVEFLPNKVRITAPTRAAVIDAFNVREGLEGMAARLAAERRSDDQAEQIIKLALSTQKNQTDRRRFQEEDREFHLLIGLSAQSAMLNTYLTNALDLALTLRNLRVADRPFQAVSAKMHIQIAEAIRDRDPDRAERASRDHVRRVRERLEDRP
jgi:GntR family transcriptional regulator, rspAB operon transcriptional repressor